MFFKKLRDLFESTNIEHKDLHDPAELENLYDLKKEQEPVHEQSVRVNAFKAVSITASIGRDNKCPGCKLSEFGATECVNGSAGASGGSGCVMHSSNRQDLFSAGVTDFVVAVGHVVNAGEAPSRRAIDQYNKTRQEALDEPARIIESIVRLCTGERK